MLIQQILQSCILGIGMLGIPVLVGSLFDGLFSHVDAPLPRLLSRWISGQMLLWACFQSICVPMILRKLRFSKVVYVYCALTAVLMLVAVGVMVKRKQQCRGSLRIVQERTWLKKRRNRILWGLFGAILLFQLVQAIRLTYADWDDAFYVAISSITAESDSMYQILPYTGGTTGLEARHGLAPFPIWIALLAKLSGVRAVSVAHVVVPVVLIAMTYGIYCLIGLYLYNGSGEKLPLFMIFTELLVLFGNYSIYSAENFMIARSRQGKAALGNIVVPVLFLLFLLLMEKIQLEKKISLSYWCLLFAVMLSACLCSTMGAVLADLLLAVAGGCIVVGYRRWKLLLPLGVCCLPGGIFLLLYLVLR
ncbi:MAG: hypothetical protein IJ833_03295 [Lachnospiraceae bacterium]|nr:hypothetical protein [Lachnospiraceae bacterium]